MKKHEKTHPLADLPYFALAATYFANMSTGAPTLSPTIPDDSTCFALWDKYSIRDNVRSHSLMVADIAQSVAQMAHDKGFPVCVDSVRASALLHDIAKSYTIDHGGSHAQIGASWVIEATGNRSIAQGVAMHVHWPWALPDNICALPFFVMYADKRIMHQKCVSLKERYEDLLERYGTTKDYRAGITASYEQGKNIERALSAQLECSLDAYTLDSGRMVERA